MLLKIGELAKRTGLTVRTLHHYDAIGLLRPSARSEAGYRLYNRQDIERLHRIQALRRMDLALAEIGSLLENDVAGLQQVIAQQIALLDRQASRAIALRDRLNALLEHVTRNVEPDLSDWLDTLEMMTVYDKYFTRDELARMQMMKAQKNQAALAESTVLVARIRALMDSQVAPESDEAQALSGPWMRLAHWRMDGDARMLRKLDALHRNEPVAQTLSGVDGALIDYMAKATAAYRLTVYARYLSEEELAPARANFMDNRMRFMDIAAELATLMEQDSDPHSPAAQALCARWLAASVEVWGRDPEVHGKVQAAHRNEPDLLVGTGITPDMLAFLQAGVKHLVEQGKKKGTNIL